LILAETTVRLTPVRSEISVAVTPGSSITVSVIRCLLAPWGARPSRPGLVPRRERRIGWREEESASMPAWASSAARPSDGVSSPLRVTSSPSRRERMPCSCSSSSMTGRSSRISLFDRLPNLLDRGAQISAESMRDLCRECFKCSRDQHNLAHEKLPTKEPRVFEITRVRGIRCGAGRRARARRGCSRRREARSGGRGG
jgi:hypothetical protein